MQRNTAQSPLMQPYSLETSAPLAPWNLQISSGDGYVNLSWEAPPHDGGSSITNYRIYRGSAPGEETFFTEVGNVLNYNDTDVSNGETYHYIITSVNLVGESSRSRGNSATPRSAVDGDGDPVVDDDTDMTPIYICVSVGIVLIIVFVLIVLLIIRKRESASTQTPDQQPPPVAAQPPYPGSISPPLVSQPLQPPPRPPSPPQQYQTTPAVQSPPPPVQAPVQAPPRPPAPPPPRQPAPNTCPVCRGAMSFIPQYQRYYCNNCRQYR